MHNETRIKNFHTAAHLAEFILVPIHAKIVVLPNPTPTGDWSAAQGNVSSHDTLRYTLQVTDSDYGKTEIKMSDGFSNDVVKIAQTIAEQVSEELKGKNFGHQDEEYIYGNVKVWEEKLKQM